MKCSGCVHGLQGMRFCAVKCLSSSEKWELFRCLSFVVVLCSVIARKKLDQVENGGCDREGSSMGSRSSSSGTPSTSNNLNNIVLMLKERMIDFSLEVIFFI